MGPWAWGCPALTDDANKPETALRQKLLDCDGVASLRAEQSIAASFARLAWWTVDHGPLYRDSDTGKLRELDVRATRQWVRPGVHSPTVNLNVLVELKSMKGFHVVFAPSSRPPLKARAQVAWAGHSMEKLGDTLRAGGLPPGAVRRALAVFTQSAFPGGEIVFRDLDQSPPSCGSTVTAFRETTIGATKELDASVLWRSVLTLTSAMSASRAQAERLLVSDIPGCIDTAQDAEELQLQLLKMFESSVRVLTIMHPVIVTDARLWLSTEDGLEPTHHVRFVPELPKSWPTSWFDVVERSAFDGWAKATTEHYRTALEHVSEAAVRRSAEALSLAFDAVMQVVTDPSLDLNITVRDRKRGPVRRVRIRGNHVIGD